MMYCDKCASIHAWPTAQRRREGQCENCGERKLCHDLFPHPGRQWAEPPPEDLKYERMIDEAEQESYERER